MWDFIVAPLVVGIICLGIYGLFELFVRRKERMAIIEKLGDKLDTANFTGKLSFPAYGLPRFSFSSLKIGCLLVGIGLGMLVGFILNLIVSSNSGHLGFELHMENQLVSAAYGASVLLFGGLGLIVAFIIETKMGNKKEE